MQIFTNVQQHGGGGGGGGGGGRRRGTGGDRQAAGGWRPTTDDSNNTLPGAPQGTTLGPIVWIHMQVVIDVSENKNVLGFNGLRMGKSVVEITSGFVNGFLQVGSTSAY